jgi:hypothetical protein
MPNPAQYVDLRLEDGSWRQGFRTISEPSTAETGEVVIRVCTEDEYRKARWENREAVGVTWPVERMRLSSSQPWRLSYRQAKGG